MVAIQVSEGPPTVKILCAQLTRGKTWNRLNDYTSQQFGNYLELVPKEDLNDVAGRSNVCDLAKPITMAVIN